MTWRTLAKTNASLIETIRETIKIQQEAREKRLESEKELVRLETELKDVLRGD